MERSQSGQQHCPKLALEGNALLGAFEKLRKATISLVMSVCLSVCLSLADWLSFRQHVTTKFPVDRVSRKLVSE